MHKVLTTGKRRGIAGSLAAIALLLGLVSASFAASSLPDTTADKVWGQGGDFTTTTAPTPATADSLKDPATIAVDAQGGVYVADYSNNRVLYYPAGSTTATRVYGQPDLISSIRNNDGSGNTGSPSATNLYRPDGLAIAPDGGLYVADYENNRVLYYPAGSTTATRVYGQGATGTGTEFTTNNAPNPPSATSLCQPQGITVDAQGGLYVADYSNNRVLYYPAGSVTATRVYGQGATGSGTEFTTNTYISPPTDTSLGGPAAVAVDAQGGIYVADFNNNRVLYYPESSVTATRVYGQPDLTSKRRNNDGSGYVGDPSANNLYGPIGVVLDSSGGIYVSDYSNSRVLHYAANPSGNLPDADQVYGQGGVFTTGDLNNGGVTPDSLNYPWGIAISPLDGSLFVADFDNSRVLQYAAPPAPPTEKEVVELHSADLIPQLRVNPDRVVATNPENLVSFSFKVKNIGAGSASNLVISMPVPQGLDVGYLDGASKGVWVTQVTTTTVTIALPTIEKDNEAHGTLVFRPNANAVAGTAIEVRYNLVYDDATKGGKSLFSNHELFVYGSAESNRDDTKGAVQPGATVSAKVGEKVSIVQNGYLADELVSQWYTTPNGTSISLGQQRANANGEITIVVDTAGLSGDYAIVGYGNRSEFTQVNILTLVAG